MIFLVFIYTGLIVEGQRHFLSKEKATSFINARSGRVRRGINEECSETEGCWHEEIKESDVSDVVIILKHATYAIGKTTVY